MKKIGILNKDISEIVASLGHKDTIVISDAGLPIPSEARRIDLALTKGIPPFIETLRVILLEMEVEEAIIAEEMKETSSFIYKEISHLLNNVPVRTVSHENFKELTHSAKAVIRTGEFIPFANIILVSGVVF